MRRGKIFYLGPISGHFPVFHAFDRDHSNVHRTRSVCVRVWNQLRALNERQRYSEYRHLLRMTP